ncbi:MAG: GAF domain-containing protein [Chloroflexi bacterium]|nr:GAF domain-containing protein [Chloroflexota bacterium]
MIISTTFYLWALVSYLAKGHWQHDAFEYWLILALLLAFCRQAFFLFYSAQLFDAYFELAMGLKIFSYLLVLAGLIASIITIFRQATRSTAELQQANQFLQQEIAERQRAEAAELAQRQERNRLHEILQQRVEEMVTLHEISQAVISSLDLATILTVVTAQATRLLKVAATSVVLVDRAADEVWFAAASGEASEYVLGKRLPLGQGIVGWVAQHGQPLLVGDAKTGSAPLFWLRPGQPVHGPISTLCTAQTEGRNIRAIEAMNKADGEFDDHDLGILTLLSGPAAAAIGNAQLYEQARQEISERLQAEAALQAERSLLAQRVAERTADLSSANDELGLPPVSKMNFWPI